MHVSLDDGNWKIKMNVKKQTLGSLGGEKNNITDGIIKFALSISWYFYRHEMFYSATKYFEI